MLCENCVMISAVTIYVPNCVNIMFLSLYEKYMGKDVPSFENITYLCNVLLFKMKMFKTWEVN